MAFLSVVEEQMSYHTLTKKEDPVCCTIDLYFCVRPDENLLHGVRGILADTCGFF